MGRKIFVTATDTGSGKTYVTAHLVRQLLAQGVDAIALKPVACGCEPGGMNEDVAQLLGAQGHDDAAAINLHSFEKAASPNIAASAAGDQIDSQALVGWCEERAAEADICLIEGVAGLMVPLHGRYRVVDWIADLKECEVVLVIGARLGAINHALLTLEQLARSGMSPHYIVINDIEPGYADDITDSITPFLPEPCKLFRIFFDAGLDEFAPIVDTLLANRRNL